MIQCAPASRYLACCVRSAQRLCLAWALTLLVTACGSPQDKTVGWSVERLYTDAKEEMEVGNWKTARERLTAIESRYPFGTYAQQALIDLAYVNWKDGEKEQALAAIDRYQQLYPNRVGMEYMLYLKGLISFTPPSSFMAHFTGQDSSERDPKGLRASYDALQELINRYPQSKYTPDAKLRITWLVNTIAMNEVHVARYYYRLGAYVAAANRAQNVMTDFSGTAATEEALSILSLSYTKLNLPDLAQDAQRVLALNYPNSKYLHTTALSNATSKAPPPRGQAEHH